VYDTNYSMKATSRRADRGGRRADPKHVLLLQANCKQ